MSEYCKSHSLHDSPINDLRYSPEQGKLILDVEICDDGQWPFIEGEPDTFPISFVFTGVSHYSVSPDPLDFEEDEINTARMILSEKQGKEIIEFVLLTTSAEGVKFLRIEAENIDWEGSERR